MPGPADLSDLTGLTGLNDLSDGAEKAEKPAGAPVDLVVTGAELVATMDAGREVAGGWVAIDAGFVVGVGPPGLEPPARRALRAGGCLVTPGLVNAHHHIYQNLTRAFAPATRSGLFGWLRTLYPHWARLDEDAVYLSAYVGLAELALGGCTTTTDHLYVHPAGGGDLLAAEIRAARELGLRFHPTRGSMSVSEKDGGLPPDSVVQDEDTILAASEAAVAAHHDPAPGAMVRIALAPCSPFTVSRGLMAATAALAERLDVRLHTHLAEDPDEDSYCLEKYGCRPVAFFEDVGWLSDRSWVAHCVHPDASEIQRLGHAGVGVAHCPSSNLLLGVGLAPVAELMAAGAPVGLGCDGSSSADSASLWLEARMALLLARHRSGAASTGARRALELATLGGAACLGRQGELGVLRPGAVGDLVCWRLDGPRFAGALSDPVEALLRCGPVQAFHTVVAGRPVVEAGTLVDVALEDRLARHRAAATRVQGLP
ncbi:MAG TPA: 8-oxoguanine deaminase [Acidimicrobiales bacterium]|nr:8-oxoguanine deaminase [Acidimicrobiales bacterium]